MAKVAVLILAHKNDRQVNTLIDQLLPDFDIYVHIDKKSSLSINDFPDKLHVYKKYKVYWGAYTQVLATLQLFREAFQRKYDNYVLISGQDLPIKSNQEIISFFEENQGIEFIEYFSLPTKLWEHEDGGFARINKYHSNLTKGFKSHSRYEDIRLFLISCYCRSLNKILKIFRKKRRVGLPLYGGANWINLTHKCLGEIFSFLQENPMYLNKFKFTKNSDEIFFHSIILNLNSSLIIFNNSLRYVDWKNGDGLGSPKVLGLEDEKAILGSSALFARKFDLSFDSDIMEKILKSNKI